MTDLSTMTDDDLFDEWCCVPGCEKDSEIAAELRRRLAAKDTEIAALRKALTKIADGGRCEQSDCFEIACDALQGAK